jgi:flagellar basal body P-ring protein FlgI
MNITGRKTICIIAILLTARFVAGCGQLDQKETKGLVPEADLGATIGSLVEVVLPESIRLEGYGLVGGLRGTGSAQCPPQIRAYLRRYILTQLPDRKIDVEKFINSPDTAVVLVDGIMPTLASKNQYFDVRVTALRGTQTTSLENGVLFGTELKTAGSFGIATRVIADAEGPVFIDKISSSETSKRIGYVLAGGKVLDEYKVSLVLHQPDFRIAGSIRNRLNGRFGDGTAKAVLPSRIELTMPAEYRERKQRFVSIVKAMYLAESHEITEERIKTFVRRLAVSRDKGQSEIALETIGYESLSKLGVLLNVSNEQVRLRAARCMLNLGSNEGLGTLGQIAMDRSSAYRLEALEAITTAARRNDAVAISRELLHDGDFHIRLAAYEQLRKLDDTAIAREFIGRNFYLEQIKQTEHETIFVSRRGQPCIVLFGAPIRCRGNIFIQSADGNITISAPAGQEYVSIIRKVPSRDITIGPLRSSFELAEIIRTLCEEPRTERGRRGGLGVSYSDIIAILKQMCDKGAVRAEFRAGPLPKIG